MNTSAKHFDNLAKNYDSGFLRNLYSSLVFKPILDIIPKNNIVLDFGCGTGETLNILSPKIGVGYDPSIEMIKNAQKKFKKNKNLSFVTDLKSINKKFNYIAMIDVIEHLENVSGELQMLKKYMNNDSKLVVSYVEGKWEKFLNILEYFNLKIQEGPHNRISNSELINIAKKAGLKLVKTNTSIFISTLIFKKKS